ncbi:hypothetical protein Pla163_03700 [Planctomycetes bacterium Pla163]|uniref:Right handed beta helix domain-containing protein n=1 Tax=Rohdeia mirabilis TaxID=2528008 RepID=A0A518CVL5_9BACT|nr:hypothetical protein Pla163_03700 [Planctomycetes bacterium Pla163]
MRNHAATLFASVHVLAVLAVAPAHAQSVHVVDVAAGAGSDFTSIGTALQAAADGDAIVVRSGSYAEFVVLGARTVTLTADADAHVTVKGLVVADLAASRSVTVRGLASLPSVFGPSDTLLIEDCAGRVWIEDCVIGGGSGIATGRARVLDSTAVALSGCTFTPGPLSFAFPVDVSLDLVNSDTALFDCQVGGIEGLSSIFGNTPARPAVRVADDRAVFTGCAIDGGPGAFGANDPSGCQNGGAGGAGIVVTGGPSTRVFLFDSSVEGGAGGSAFPGCSSGADGVAVQQAPGTSVFVPPGQAPRLHVESPLRSGDLFAFELTGTPGAATYLDLGFAPGAPQLARSVFTGAVVVGGPTLLVPFVPLPASGLLDESVVQGTLLLPPGLGHLPLFVQPVLVDPVLGLAVGTPSALLLVDASL